MDNIIIDTSNVNVNHHIKYKKKFYDGKTDFQKIDLVDSDEFGKMLVLDGAPQTSIADEWTYHESLVHPAMCSHPNPKRVLIIGGGDGGTMEEVLKYKTVESVIMCEIDGQIVDFSKKHLPEISKNAFSDKRAKVIIGDGRKFVDDTKERFDVVLVDLTDPNEFAIPVYTKEFYEGIKRVIGPNGVLALHSEVPFDQTYWFITVQKTLRSVFKNVSVLLTHIPVYNFTMSFAVCSETIDASKLKKEYIAKRLTDSKVGDLMLYSPEMHEAMFVNPPWIKKLLSMQDKYQISTDKKPLEIKKVNLKMTLYPDK